MSSFIKDIGEARWKYTPLSETANAKLFKVEVLSETFNMEFCELHMNDVLVARDGSANLIKTNPKTLSLEIPRSGSVTKRYLKTLA